ncbi:MAG: 4'-phosphopantetheinyl transferase superfamily protein [Gammaproteobacteria bacterium]|nr:4'-phosphopantetheinyl transferase superfamily protein [Gammaproteobacteria bacterium]
MNIVRLYYIRHQGESDLTQVNEKQVNKWSSELSLPKQASVQRLLHHSDRLASLLATQLLMMCAQHEDIKSFRLADVQYPDKGKPCWKSKTGDFFDFNISHSDKVIVVVTSKTVNVGVDAEKIRELKSLSFKKILSADELIEIQKSPGRFFDLWSKKEAVVKAANTTGLGRMSDVKLKQNHAVLDEKKWYLKNIDLNNQYAIHLATSEPVDEVIIKQILISKLLTAQG